MQGTSDADDPSADAAPAAATPGEAPPTPAVPWWVLIAALAGGLVATTFLVLSGWAQTRTLVRDRVVAELASAREDLAARRGELLGRLDREVETLGELPTLKAAAGTGDALTVAQTMAEALGRPEGAEVYWLHRGPRDPESGAHQGGGVAVRLVLGDAPRAEVGQVAPEEHAGLFSFGADGGGPAALPASLPGFEWPVVPVAAAVHQDPLVAALADVNRRAAARLAEAPGAAPPAITRPVQILAARGGALWAVSARPMHYKGGGYLGLLASGAPVTGAMLEDAAARLRGVASLVRVDAGGMHHLLASTDAAAADAWIREGAMLAGAWSAEPALVAAAHGERLVQATPLAIAGSSDEVLVHLDADFAAAMGDLGFEDLKPPLMGLLVGAFLLAVLAIPIGVQAYVLRPREAPVVAPAPVQARPIGGGVKAVLERFPEDRYGKPKLLGKGGMGVVFRLEDSVLGRPLALKIMEHEGGEEDLVLELTSRFLREARAMATFDHPGLPRIHDVVEQPTPYFVMEFIEGQSLQARYDDGGDLDEPNLQDPAEVCGWLAQACDALGHAHEHGIIHRDIKPDNLMLDVEGRVRVIDFGVALMDQVTRVTKAGFFVGTLGFGSPEQLGHSAEDARSDVYSLAATGYFLVSGRLPYSTPQLAVGKGFDPAPLPDAVPRPLARCLARALTMNPDQRPQNMAAFRDELLAAAEAIERGDEDGGAADPPASAPGGPGAGADPGGGDAPAASGVDFAGADEVDDAEPTSAHRTPSVSRMPEADYRASSTDVTMPRMEVMESSEFRALKLAKPGAAAGGEAASGDPPADEPAADEGKAD